MGIETQNESTLHATLKRYLEPNEDFHEVKVGRYVADIKRNDKIFEIQTRCFYRLIPKLERFLCEHKVTVVYPIASKKTIVWIDPETGESSSPRLSPKRGRLQELFYELVSLQSLLGHTNLSFRVILLELNEMRLQDGWGRGGKRGSHRVERIPGTITDDILFSERDDWDKMIPQGLVEPFTVKEYAKACSITPTCATRGLLCLVSLGVLERIGKKRNAYLYQRTSADTAQIDFSINEMTD